MNDTSLFQLDEARIDAAPDRNEPIVWIRRLVIVEQRNEEASPIRDIRFRRGLNIISTEQATDADTEPVGHNVGKTLLTRLVRYCLGESHFADRATRAAVCSAFPQGYVLAEIVVGAECWSVARPIGVASARDAWAMRAEDCLVLLGDVSAFPGYDTLREAMEFASLGPLRGLEFPQAERQVRWLDLLAWLSRDQYCRYRHPHEWRSPEADSGTANPSMEDAAFLVRATIGLLDQSEQQIIADRRTSARKKELLEHERQVLEQRIEFARDYLIRQLELSDDAIVGPAFGEVARQRATARRGKLEELLNDVLSGSTLDELEQGISAAAEAVGEHIGELKQVRTRRTEEATRLEQARTAGRDDFYAGFADPVANCPAGYCPMKRATSDDSEPWREQEIEQLRRQVAHRDRQIADLELAKSAAEEQLSNVRHDCEHERARVAAHKAGIERQMGMLDAVAREGERYVERYDERDRLVNQIEAAEKRIEQLRDQQRAAQEQLARSQQQFRGYFDYVVRALVGQAVEGRLDLTLRGLEVSIDDSMSSTGEALSTSSKVLSLDFASLIGSVCGLGSHPRLLIHDSPREADLEPHIYGRLFQLVRELERRCGNSVSFQYIVTTTTAPPPEVADSPYAICSLHRRSEEGMLLKRRIR